MRTDSGKSVRLVDYRPPDYLIDTVDLDIKLAPRATRVRALLALRPNPAGRAGAPLILDGDGLIAETIALDGAVLDLAAGFATADRLTIEAPPQRPFSLLVETSLDPSANSQLMGLYKSGSAYCTQCEAEGFRRITYFLDRPDVLSTYTVRIEANKAEAPVLLANGNPLAHGDIAGTGNHFAVWHDPFPKPCYLFALVGGDLGRIDDRFTTRGGRSVRLAIYVEPGKEAQAAYAMDALKRSMAWDEKVFGREYDLDVFNIVAVSDFNMGAMENKGLNIFNDKYVLASPQTATDTDFAGIESVIAHEYFHNWTGNRITCRDWFQLCLKEGLTVFRDQEFSSDERSRTVKRITDVRTLRSTQFAEDAGPLAHSVRPDSYREINNFYTATVYNKGAELIRMLRTLIGAKAFSAGMALYFSRCDASAATIEDFLACFAESAGRDLAHFAQWYEQAGTPVVTASGRRDPVSRTYEIYLSQATRPTPGQPNKRPMVIPIALGLVTPAGGACPLHLAPAGAGAVSNGADEVARGIVVLDEAARFLVFHQVDTDVVPSLMRGFSAPVRLEVDYNTDQLLTLIRHDADGFNRWQAVQDYATRSLLAALARLRAGAPASEDIAFVDALGEVLRGAADDPAFVAQVLSLPGESELMQTIGSNVDPDAIHVARDDLYRQIGRRLGAALLSIHQALADNGPYRPDAANAGRRSLRNSAMLVYAMGEPAAGQALAEQQFAQATNMTDRLAAAQVLALIPGAARESMLDSFYRQFSEDPLVLDKWLSLQAAIPEAATLDRVIELTRHPAFAWSNPNRVRALIGTFSTLNPTQFHRPDGRGYEYLIDTVARLDDRNPQLAARLLAAFRSWRTLESGRAGHAKAALLRLGQWPKLSPDVSDILTRTLADPPGPPH
jgi:aminopeptidase N